MSYHILIADDNTFYGRLIQHVLKYVNPSLKFTFARDGRQAVNLAIEHHPDLIFMDVYMPNMNGVRATVHLRKHKETCLIPIIITTADPRSNNVIICYRAGCSSFLSKPFSNTYLVKLYHQHTASIPKNR